jgi:hypothetical protein
VSAFSSTSGGDSCVGAPQFYAVLVTGGAAGVALLLTGGGVLVTGGAMLVTGGAMLVTGGAVLVTGGAVLATDWPCTWQFSACDWR